MISATAVDNADDLLDLQSVTKAYRLETKEFLAVKEISLHIKPREFVCLLGPSGCGKSTLLRIIAGLNAVTSGVVSYHGQPLKGVNPYTTIVFQTFALYPWLTVQENVEIALKARGVAPAERVERALKLIDIVGLDGFESAYPRELSGGMRQKVGFARAMAVEPELLCLDEPFSALDVLSAEALRGELMELWLNKKIPTKAILMVTHNIEEAVFMADRIVIMGKDPGHIVTEIAVTLRHPRQRKDTAFQSLVDKVYAAVAGQSEAAEEALGTQPGQPGVTRTLPNSQLNAVAGLLEKLVDEGGRVDLYRMGGDLVLELDGLLPIVEAGDLLGFITVHEGDLLLTPLGRAYADATILARKAIIAGRVLRLPVIGWIYETLQRDDNGRVARDYFHDKLQADFGDEAEEQLDIAISWGRQAELFAYDADTRELYLESYEGHIAEKSLALAELYEAWPVLSRRDRVEGFKLLQRDDAETVYYAYVTDAEERLLGTVTFRDLLITPGDKTVQEVMRTDVITAPEHLNQEALSELFARYNLQMIPVVDSEKRIKGVVSKE